MKRTKKYKISLTLEEIRMLNTVFRLAREGATAERRAEDPNVSPSVLAMEWVDFAELQEKIQAQAKEQVKP